MLNLIIILFFSNIFYKYKMVCFQRRKFLLIMIIIKIDKFLWNRVDKLLLLSFYLPVEETIKLKRESIFLHSIRTNWLWEFRRMAVVSLAEIIHSSGIIASRVEIFGGMKFHGTTSWFPSRFSDSINFS